MLGVGNRHRLELEPEVADPRVDAVQLRLVEGALPAVVAAILIGITGVLAGLINGSVVLGGSPVVSLNGGALAWTVGAFVIASLVMASGTVAAIASWVGAFLNTSRSLPWVRSSGARVRTAAAVVSLLAGDCQWSPGVIWGVWYLPIFLLPIPMLPGLPAYGVYAAINGIAAVVISRVAFRRDG